MAYTKEEALIIARDYINSGFSYTAIGKKYGKLLSKGGNPANLDSIAPNVGKQIISNDEIRSAIVSLSGYEREVLTDLFKKKVKEHLENPDNPNVSLNAAKLMGQYLGILSENVNIKADIRQAIAEFVVDPSN